MYVVVRGSSHLVVWTPLSASAAASRSQAAVRCHRQTALRGIKSTWGSRCGFAPLPVSTPSQAAFPQAWLASYRYPLGMTRKSVLKYVVCNLFTLALTISLVIAEAEAKEGGKNSSPVSSSRPPGSGYSKLKTTKIRVKNTKFTRCYNEQ